MLLPTKKTHLSCLGLLADLSEMSLENGARQQGRTRSQSIAISGPKTPRPSIANNYSSSPEIEFFAAPQRTRHASRWKEDWEELEMLVSSLHLFYCVGAHLRLHLYVRGKELSDQLSRLATRLTRATTQVRFSCCPSAVVFILKRYQTNQSRKSNFGLPKAITKYSGKSTH